VNVDWKFATKVILTSVVVFLVLPYLTNGYEFALGHITGTHALSELPYVSSQGLCPFLVFIFMTPRLGVMRRLIAVTSGLIGFFAIDLIMTLIWIPYLESPRPSLRNMGVHYGYYVVVYYVLPFLLWFVFAFRQIETLFKGKGSCMRSQ